MKTEIPNLIYVEPEKAPDYCFVVGDDGIEKAYLGKNKKLGKLIAASPDLLALAEEVLSFLVHDDRAKSPLADQCRMVIQKATT